jgi:uncharacterized protein YqgC (DUF456 family)
MLEITIYIVAGIFALTGLILTIFNFPGIWFVYISTVVLAFYTDFEKISPLLLLILFFVAILSTFIDNIVAALGAKKMGGSKWGMLGAILGGIFGFIIGNFIGFVLGPLIGATLFELIFADKELNEAFKSGVGSLIGVFISIFLKVAVNIFIIVFVLSRLL